jgi:hypothetical protein
MKEQKPAEDTGGREWTASDKVTVLKLLDDGLICHPRELFFPDH